jgi:hypothetical protein
MRNAEIQRVEAPAHVLALILSADGCVSEQALQVLGGLDAFSLLAVSRARFLELARHCTRRIDPGLCERSWLSEEEVALADALIDRVRAPHDRRLVCRLAAAAVEEDGRITHGTRLMLDHVLARWHADQAALPCVAH